MFAGRVVSTVFPACIPTSCGISNGGRDCGEPEVSGIQPVITDLFFAIVRRCTASDVSRFTGQVVPRPTRAPTARRSAFFVRIRYPARLNSGLRRESAIVQRRLLL